MSIRCVIKRVVTGAIQLADFTGRWKETFTKREVFQQYGHCSKPLPGAEGIVMFLNGDPNNAVIIATEDRRYRIDLVDGEVAMYSDEGDYVHFQRGNNMKVYSKKNIDMEACEKIKFKAPLIELYGAIQSYDIDGGAAGTATFHGNVISTGQVCDYVRAMSGDRVFYNGHTHPPNDHVPSPQE